MIPDSPNYGHSEEVLDRIRRTIGGADRRRFGQLAIERGWASETHVEEALCAQAQERTAGQPRRIGEILVSAGRLTDEQVSDLLREQGRRVLDAMGLDSSGALPAEVFGSMDDPDRRLDDYVLVETIGRGGMNEVWKAWDLDLGRWVAIKILRAEGREATDRFLREARLAARLVHPHITTIHGTGAKDGIPYIAMQLVDGGPAGPGPLPPRDAARIVRDAARAVHHAHDRGVVHRDLKPANLLVNREGSVLVADFGLAREVRAPAGTTFPGTVLGTPAYMSPEQARGDLERVGPASDVFSLGATLFELCTGRPPYAGMTANETLVEAIRCEPRPPRALNARIPKDLESILLVALDRDPSRRYGSPGALGEDLERYLSGEAIEARPPSSFDLFRRRIRRNPWAWALAAAAVALLAAGILSVAGVSHDRAEDRHLRDLLARAERRYGEGDLEGTRSLLHAALSMRPEDEMANYWITRLMIREYQAIRGVPEVRIVSDLIEFAPPRPETPETRSMREEIERRLRASPQGEIGRGVLALWSGNRDAARAEFGRVLKDSAGFREAEVYSAIASFLDGDFTQAERRLLSHRGVDRDLTDPILGEVWLALGQVASLRGLHEQAERRYLQARALGIEMGAPRGNVLEARAFVALGRMEADRGKDPEPRYANAISRLQGLEDPYAHAARGDVYMARAEVRSARGRLDFGDPAEIRQAIEEFTRAIRNAASPGPFLVLRGGAHLARHDYRQKGPANSLSPHDLQNALNDFERALLQAPDYPAARISRAQAETKLANFISPETPFDRKKILASFRGMTTTLEQVANELPDYGPAHHALAEAYDLEATMLRNFYMDPKPSLRKCIAALDRAVALNPHDARALRMRGKQKSNLALQRSMEGLDPQELDEGAWRDFDRALEANSSHYLTYLMRGEARGVQLMLPASQAPDPEAAYLQAFGDLSKAIELNPMHSPSYLARGGLSGKWAARLEALGGDAVPSYDAAIRDLDDAIRLIPRAPHPYAIKSELLRSKARVFAKRGKDPVPLLEAALLTIGEAIQRFPTLPGSHAQRGNIRMQIARYLTTIGGNPRGQILDAIHDFNEFIQLAPHLSAGYRKRGKARALLAESMREDAATARKERAKAVADLLEAVRRRPGDRDAKAALEALRSKPDRDE